MSPNNDLLTTPKPRIQSLPAGFKLGHTVPWVTGFPFNVVRHPQYVGSIASAWGLALMLWSQGPPGLGLVTVYWTALVAITGLTES
jgi:protein-S-isoprenylcysteine O-methyltransferase Ste14